MRGKSITVARFESLKQELADINPVGGITPVEVASLPVDLRVTFKRMLKNPMTVDELALEWGLTEDETREIGKLLVEKGFLQNEDSDPEATLYRVRFARVRSHYVPPEL